MKKKKKSCSDLLLSYQADMKKKRGKILSSYEVMRQRIQFANLKKR